MNLVAAATTSLALTAAAAPGGTVLYVDADAPGASTGADWANALPGLQDALDAAALDPTVTQIRVAEGVYTPSRPNVPSNPRTSTFRIAAGLTVRGSFAGHGASDPDLQDLRLFTSTLTGDLAGDDVAVGSNPTVFLNQDENAYRVVQIAEAGTATALEGFRIVAGRADGSVPYHRGGGVHMRASAAEVRDCLLAHNSSQDSGGGMYINGGFNGGPGIVLYPSVADTRFVDNYSEEGPGGGLRVNTGGGLIAVRCSFLGNQSDEGDGGAVSTGNFTVFGSCEFSGNTAPLGRGGAVASTAPTFFLVGCTFSRNTADLGGAVFADVGSIHDSILWGNDSLSATTAFEEQALLDMEVVDVQYSCLQDWPGGGSGNLALDPRFVQDTPPAGSSDVDLRLLPGSPCIDAGNNILYFFFGEDVAGQPRFQDDPLTPDTGVGGGPIVDIGAHELVPFVPGTAFCFGDGTGTPCPCGNTSAPGEGCTHSGGQGMTILGIGTTSLAADDLTIVVQQVPPGNSALLFSGITVLPGGVPFGDGLRCAVGSTLRFAPQFQTTGSFVDSGFVAQDPSGVYFQPGTGYTFQLWTRDAAAGPSPCGTGTNLSPAYSVTMTP